MLATNRRRRVNQFVATTLLSLATLAASFAPLPASASQISHYMGGLMNLDDYFMPAPELGELIYAQYNLYYGSDTFRNHDGDRLDKLSVTGPNGGTVAVDVDIDLDLWTVAPLLMWVPDAEILGGRYGAFVVLPFGGPSIGASLDTEIGQISRRRHVDESNVGLADMFAQPLWLQWKFGRADLTAGYGFWAPTGKYTTGEPDNVGLGFWEHQLQSAVRVSCDDAKTLTAMVAFTAEINHNKQGVDLVPGPQMTVNWGLRKDLFDHWLQLGVLGYDSWQMADDSGSDAGAPADRHQDSVHAAGVQIGVPRLGLYAKYVHEYEARDRFEGQMFTLMFGLPLDPVVDWVASAL